MDSASDRHDTSGNDSDTSPSPSSAPHRDGSSPPESQPVAESAPGQQRSRATKRSLQQITSAGLIASKKKRTSVYNRGKKNVLERLQMLHRTCNVDFVIMLQNEQGKVAIVESQAFRGTVSACDLPTVANAHMTLYHNEQRKRQKQRQQRPQQQPVEVSEDAAGELFDKLPIKLRRNIVRKLVGKTVVGQKAHYQFQADGSQPPKLVEDHGDWLPASVSWQPPGDQPPASLQQFCLAAMKKLGSVEAGVALEQLDSTVAEARTVQDIVTCLCPEEDAPTTSGTPSTPPLLYKLSSQNERCDFTTTPS
jgi:hypothetical protein